MLEGMRVVDDEKLVKEKVIHTGLELGGGGGGGG